MASDPAYEMTEEEYDADVLRYSQLVVQRMRDDGLPIDTDSAQIISQTVGYVLQVLEDEDHRPKE